jgi:hypothetical protein
MMTPETSETQGEQAYAEIPTVRRVMRTGGDGASKEDKSACSLVVAWVVAGAYRGVQDSAFENFKIESQSNNEIPFLIFIPSFIKVLKVSANTDGHVSVEASRVALVISSSRLCGPSRSRVLLRVARSRTRRR